MDCGVDYIKMCEEAVEIQKVWRPITTDWCFGFPSDAKESSTYDGSPRKRQLFIVREPSAYRCRMIKRVDGKTVTCGYEVTDNLNVWLPRQDQLQDMIERVKETTGFFKHVLFHEFIKYHGSPHNTDSMEQLWLAFVMKEKFNKSWDGKGWVTND